MKITLIGAGFVGEAIGKEATFRGHELHLGTRSGKKHDYAHTSFAIDLSDTAALQQAINDSDVTIIAVAQRDNFAATEKAHKDLIAAGFNGRLIIVGGAGSLLLPDGSQLKDSADFPAEYFEEADVFSRILDAYRESKDNWTVVSPSPVIAPGGHTGDIRISGDTPAGDSVTTGDFAFGILNEIEKPQHERARFTIASA